MDLLLGDSLMSNHSIPSRLKGLSLAVAQIVAVASAATSVSAQAAPCSNYVANNGSRVISADATEFVCGGSAVSVTLSSGVALTADAGYTMAVNVGSGTVELESGASIVNNKVDMNAYGAVLGLAPGLDKTVTLGENASIQSSSDNAKGARVTGISTHSYQNATTINLNAGSSVSGTATSSSEYAEGAAVFVNHVGDRAVGENVVISGQETTVSASASGVASVPSGEYQAGSIAIDVIEATNVSIDLSASSVASSASLDTSDNGVRGSAGAAGIIAEARSSNDSVSVSIDLQLDNTVIEVNSRIEGGGYGEAVANGIRSEAYGEGVNNTIDINGGSLAVTAAEVLDSDDSNNGAVSTAIRSEAGSDNRQDLTHQAITLRGGAEITSTASSSYSARAEGIVVDSYSETASITLDNASIDTSAEGVYAFSRGISANGRNLDIDLVDADLTVSVSNPDSAKGGYAEGIGIEASGEDVAIELTRSSLTVDVNASNGNENKYSVGVLVEDGDDNASVILNDSHILVENGFGIADTSYGAMISLDSGSTIEAEIAILALGNNAVLENGGSITGAVIMPNGSIDNTGIIAGQVIAENLTGRTGSELQVVLTDEVDPEQPYFQAVNAVLEPESIVHLNAKSELYNPEIDGVDMLILAAQNTLDADTDELILKTSGLIGAQWLDCGPQTLCVNVRSLELEEIASNDGSSINGVDAAGAAQSVLEELSGTDVGDEFFELVERVVDDKAWEDIDGSGQGENLLASRDAERVVSRYVQRLMQQGRSSGEEFSAAQGLWMQALQTDGDGDSDNGVAGFEVDTTGFAMGYDRELRPGLVIGGVISNADTEVQSDDNSNRVDTDTLMASVYGQWTQGALFANAVMTYGSGDNDSRREVVGDIASADYDSDFLSLRIQAGKGFGYESGWKLSPRVEVVYNHVDIDSYDESGSIAALSVAAQSYETIELGLGLEIAKPIIIEKAVLTPYFDLAVYHDFADDQVQSTSRFVIGGNSFVTYGSDVEQTNVSATLGLSYDVGANHGLKAAYEYFGNSSYDSASWMLRYSYSF